MHKAIVAASATLSISLVLLTGCGQTGPLYKPEAPETNQAEESSTETEPTETS